MDKLLHERFRDDASMGEQWFSPVELLSFADEIERYYIPRPRFEDGEPLQFDEDVMLKDGTPCPATTLGMSFDGTLFVNPCSREYRCIIELKEGETVQRPKPKVYDAAGVEIKVGDTVYILFGTDEGKKLTVKGFEHCDSGEIYVSCGENNILPILRSPSDLTHKEPVLDADGAPINVGDTVWSKLGNAWTVDSVASEIEVYVIGSDGNSSCFTAGYLTHKEPDSLEKLHDDMLNEFEMLSKLELKKYANRLSALIERSA